MIVNTLNCSAQYEVLHPSFSRAFSFLRQYDFTAVELGRMELDGTALYALVQSYNTEEASQKRWEAHEKYIDIQYVVDGTEICGWAPADTLLPDTSYNQEKDVRFFTDGAPFTPVRLEKGSFAILYPEDIHKPGCAAGLPEAVIKVVVKVRI